MGTVDFATSRLEWTFRPIDISIAEAQRLAEFFDGSLDRVGSFLRETWLPDASVTLQTLIRESGRSSQTRMTFLCDHLREGARSAGINTIVRISDEIDKALASANHDSVRLLAAHAIRAISQLCLQLAA